MEQRAEPPGEPFAAWPEFVAEAKEIVDAARERALHLRLLGALAVIEQCPDHRWLLEKTNRVLTDLDFMGYQKEVRKAEQMFRDLGYEILGGRGVTMDVWADRRIFHDPAGRRRRVDLFLDRLDFCHPINLTGRLDLDPVTIPLTDLLLEKLQIVEINEKDLKDLVVLLLEHDVSDRQQDGAFDAGYAAGLLSADWGFYYTVSLNFERIRRYAETIPDLDVADRETIGRRIDQLWQRAQDAPKGMRWKLRARVGTSRRWYNQVGEGYRDIGQDASAGGETAPPKPHAGS
jgi:hypothetical protein